MRLNQRRLTFVSPRFFQPIRHNVPRAKLILVLALTSVLSYALHSYGQTTVPSSASAIQAPEQCNYATDQDSRPAATSASAEAAAALNTTATEGLRLPEIKSDKASAGQQDVECKPEDSKKPAQLPASKLAAAPAPAQPQPAPLVAYSNGLLTITAHDARFGDVLNAIRARTGVTVEYPAGLANDRVFDDIGPAPMREVLMTFLDGSRFNYVMRGSSSDPRVVHELILTPRSGSAAMAANQPRASAVPKEADAYGQGTVDETQQYEPQPQPVPAAHVNPLPASVGKALQEEAAALQQANPQMTHGEILAEMQKRNDDRLDREAAQSEQAAPQPAPQQ